MSNGRASRATLHLRLIRMCDRVTQESCQSIRRRSAIRGIVGAYLALPARGRTQGGDQSVVAGATCEVLLKKHQVPGAVVAFVERGGISWIAAKGFADKGVQPMGAETSFEAASLSKPVFACAVLRLCEQGKLSLDSELGGLLREEDLPSDVGFRRVTVRQI